MFIDFHSSLLRDNHTQIFKIAGDLSMNTSPGTKSIIGQKRYHKGISYLGIKVRLELEG